MICWCEWSILYAVKEKIYTSNRKKYATKSELFGALKWRVQEESRSGNSNNPSHQTCGFLTDCLILRFILRQDRMLRYYTISHIYLSRNISMITKWKFSCMLWIKKLDSSITYSWTRPFVVNLQLPNLVFSGDITRYYH